MDFLSEVKFHLSHLHGLVKMNSLIVFVKKHPLLMPIWLSWESGMDQQHVLFLFCAIRKMTWQTWGWMPSLRQDLKLLMSCGNKILWSEIVNHKQGSFGVSCCRDLKNDFIFVGLRIYWLNSYLMELLSNTFKQSKGLDIMSCILPLKS